MKPSTGPQLVWEYTNPVAVTTVPAVVVRDADCNYISSTPQPPKMAATKFQLNTGANSPWQLFTSFRYSAGYPGLKYRVVQYSDGAISANAPRVSGYGRTLTGQPVCHSIPCRSGSSAGATDVMPSSYPDPRYNDNMFF